MDQASQQLFTLLIILAVIGLALMPRKWRGSGVAFGTARLADVADLVRAGMFRYGLILGQLRDGTLIRMPRYTHLATFAPTGAGKGVSLIVPWLKTYTRGSMVVLDPKGENALLTMRQRQAMGQKIVILDPFRVVTDTPDTFNPLDLIADGVDSLDAARAMAEAMVIRTGEEKDPHWNDQGANLLTFFIAFTLSELRKEERNLASLRELMSQEDLCRAAVELMRKNGGVYARMAGVVSQLEDKEKAGVFSTAHRHTTFLDSPAILESIAKSSFNAKELLAGNMTIYLVLPPFQLEAQSRWMRLIIATLTRLILREGMRKGKESLFLLDEAGIVLRGSMPAVEEGLVIGRSYGLKMAFFFQSLGQLRETFRNKESVLLDNTEQIYFGVNSYETAERVSKMLGNQTITVESASENTSWSRQDGYPPQRSVSGSSSRSWQEQGRELMKPDEILTMSGDYLIAFLRGIPPIVCRRVKWYQDRRFGGAAGRTMPPSWWPLLAAAAGMIAWAMMRR